MFQKLLKYDIKSVAKLWWIGAVLSFSSGILGSLLIRFFMYVEETETDSIFLNLFGIFSILVAILCIFTMALSSILTMVLVFVRFYKHLFTDEGYLTFTLPVSRGSHLASKTVNAVLWLSLHMIVLGLSFFLFLWFVIPPENGIGFIGFDIFKYIGELIKFGWDGLGAWMIVYVLEALLYVFISTIFSVTLVHFCISFAASLVKKAKLVVAIGLYYAFSSLNSLVIQFGSFFFNAFFSEGMWIFLEEASVFEENMAMACFFLIIICAIATISFVFYSVTQYLLERKLNLA